MDRLSVRLNNYFDYLHKDGFKLDVKTVDTFNVNKQYDRLVIYFSVDRKGRSDDEIDMLARQHKVELYLITGLPCVGLKYIIVD